MTILRSSLLAAYDNLVFGISTRLGGVSPPPFGMNLSYHVGDESESVNRNAELFFGALGIPLDLRAVPKQVHSNIVKRIDSVGIREECDGLVTDSRNVFLCVSIADCVPIFLYDPEKNAVAAIHAGWRGTTNRICTNAVRSMKEEFGSQTEDLLAYIGPAAGSCCYVVGEDVAKQFDGTFVRRGKEVTYVDLKAANIQQLVDEGVSRARVELSGYCTICHPELLHSYRRDKRNSGRMMGAIGLRG